MGPVFASIKGNTESLPNVLSPIEFDAREPVEAARDAKMTPESFDVVFTAKLLHRSQLETCKASPSHRFAHMSHLIHAFFLFYDQGVIIAAAQLLKPGGYLYIYGPFKRGVIFFTDDNKVTPDHWPLHSAVETAQTRPV